MSKSSSVMGGQSTSEVRAAWREACAQVQEGRKTSGLNLSGKDRPLPSSNAGLVAKWRTAGAAVEKQLSPKKAQRAALKKVVEGNNLQAAQEASAVLDEMGEDNGEA